MQICGSPNELVPFTRQGSSWLLGLPENQVAAESSGSHANSCAGSSAGAGRGGGVASSPQIREMEKQVNDVAIARGLTAGKVHAHHSAAVNSLDFHRSEDALVTAADDDSVALWSTESGELNKTVPAKKYGASCVTCTHHRDAVLTASRNGWDETVRYLSLFDNRYLRYFRGHSAPVKQVCMHPSDDHFLTAAKDGEVRMWDLRAPVCEGLLRCDSEPAIAFDEQGFIFAASIRAGEVKLFDAGNYDRGPFETQQVFPGENPPLITHLQFSKSGNRLLAAHSNGFAVLDSYKFDLISSFSLRTGEPPGSEGGAMQRRVTFSPDGHHVVAGEADGSVRVFNVSSSTELDRLKAHAAYPVVAKFSNKRMLAATGALDGQLVLWSPQQRES